MKQDKFASARMSSVTARLTLKDSRLVVAFTARVRPYEYIQHPTMRNNPLTDLQN